MKKAPKGRNVVGIVPLSGWHNSFDFPWPDYLQPLREGFLAVERSVYECAYAGCDSIWVVCNDDVAPIIKKIIPITNNPTTSANVLKIINASSDGLLPKASVTRFNLNSGESIEMKRGNP